MIPKVKRKKVMKCLCNVFYGNNFKNDINLEIVSKKTKIPMVELLKISANLESMGLLKMSMLEQNYSGAKIGTQLIIREKDTPSAIVSLTENGKCYFETRQDRMFEFLRQSVLTPILVTILTTLLLHLLSKYLPRMIELAQLYLNF